ncbi:MAG: O-Antigen ligase [Smithella sp. PtaU1.Bin162]|nr:MAG: O-Antigen ligase [Smithella sp. PtaU1.Bin162]
MNRQALSLFTEKHEKLFKILNHVVPVMIGIFIFCTPFPYTTAVTNISFYGAILLALFLLIFGFRKFTFQTPLTYPLIVFFLWSALSIVWALNVENTLSDVRGHLLNYIFLYFLLINFFRTKRQLDILAWVIVLSATFFSVGGMIYYYVILNNPVDLTRLGQVINSINISSELPGNMIGTLNITAILFCLYLFRYTSNRHQQVVIILCASACFVAMILTQSRGTLIAIIVAMSGLFLLMGRKKLFAVFLIIVIAGVFFLPVKNMLDKNRLNFISFDERLKINYVTYEVWKDYPLMGIGFGMRTFDDNINKEAYVKKIPEKNRPVTINTTHSWLLDITLRLGLIGLILFLLIIFVFIKMCIKVIRRARDESIRHWGIYVLIAFAAYFIIGLAEPVFLFTASALIFYIFLAMITILSRLSQEEQIAKAQSGENRSVSDIR